MAYITTYLVVDQCWQVEGNIMSGAPAWFNGRGNFPAGYYRISYVTGAFKFNITHGWAVSTQWSVSTSNSGGTVDLVAAPAAPQPVGPRTVPNGVFVKEGFDTPEAAINANKSIGSRDFYHAGGPLGMVLYDNPYQDNVHGSPDPTWKLCSLKEKIDLPQGCENLTLYNSGLQDGGPTSGGQPDAQFKILASDQSTTPATVFTNIPTTWTANSQNSKWIGVKTSGSYPADVGVYTFRYSIDLTKYDPFSVRMQGQWAADDTGVDIIVNGNSTGQTTGSTFSYSAFRLESLFIRGINTIDFVVRNSAPSAMGLRVEWLNCVACKATTPIEPEVSSVGTEGNESSVGSVASIPSSSAPQTCEKETPQTGLLSSDYKTLLDSLPTNPGGFGFVFKPGIYINEHDYTDSVLTGDIKFVSNSLDIDCEVKEVNGVSQTVFSFAVGQNFLDAFCLEVPGLKGKTGDTGEKGPQGRHGTGNGPQGDRGPAGKDATVAHSFTGIKVVEVDDVYDTAVVGFNLDPAKSLLEVVKAKVAVPENDEPATMVSATPIYRDVNFASDTAMLNYEIFAPAGDAVSAITRTADIDIIKLPDGWSGSIAGVTTMKLSKLIKLIVEYYDGLADGVITKWDRQIKEFLANKDADARTVIADLAMELTQCEWSAPIELCIDIEPLRCVGDEGGGGGGTEGNGVNEEVESPSSDSSETSSSSSEKIVITPNGNNGGTTKQPVFIPGGGGVTPPPPSVPPVYNTGNEGTCTTTTRWRLTSSPIIVSSTSGFTWEAGERGEPGRNNNLTSFLKISPSGNLPLVDNLQINGGSDDLAFMFPDTGSNTVIQTPGSYPYNTFEQNRPPVSFRIPSASIFFRDTDGWILSQQENRGGRIDPCSAQKTIDDGTHKYTFQRGTKSNHGKGHAIDIASAGFRVRRWGDRFSLQDLTSFSIDGRFKFKFAHIVSGEGNAEVRIAGSNSSSNLPDTVYVACVPLASGMVNDSDAKWITPKAKGNDTVPPGVYTFRYAYVIPNNAKGIELFGTWAADDKGIDIKVNGASTGQKSNTSLQYSNFTIKNLNDGTNTIDFVVQNTSSSNSAVGLKVRWSARRV